MFSRDITYGSSSMGFDSNEFKKKTSIGLLGNIHGNEATGRELLLWFAKYFCHNAKVQALRTTFDPLSQDSLLDILDQSNIFVLPTINPKGFAQRIKEEYRDNTFSK